MSSLSPKYLSALLFPTFLLLVSGCGSSGSSDGGVVLPSGSPEITVLGSNPRHLTINDAYVPVDPGAEAWDAEDGNLTSLIDFNASNVDMSTAGTYAAIYSVTDSDGNTATAYRIELVFDPAAPFVYEDAEDNNTLGWSIYDNDPAGATISNVFDADQGSQVIKLAGDQTTNGYELRFERYDGTFVDWNNADHTALTMDMKFDNTEIFKVIVKCETDAGLVWVTYANYPDPYLADANASNDDPYWNDINASLVNTNTWEPFSTDTVRSLSATITEANVTNSLLEIDGLRIKGSMSVDNITTIP